MKELSHQVFLKTPVQLTVIVMRNRNFITKPMAIATALKSRSLGKRVVFTNGCFDILHAGHVYLLNQASVLGDLLIVGLNDDDSVRRLKGDGHPRIPLELRAYSLGGLSSVSYVVPFSEDTPLELILTLQPDVLVKGGDYAKEDIVGAAETESWGGVVEIIPLIEGLSSSSILPD